MIYDGLGAIERYRGLYKGLDMLIDWLAEHDPAELPVGSNEICGKRVFANVMNATTRAAEDAHFEWHEKYMDVQMDLEGAEAFQVTPGATVSFGEFDTATDGGLCDLAPENTDVISGTLGQGRFVIFVVGEPHCPTLVLPGKEPAPVKKICFKVVADEFWDEV